jgi:glyoxylase-like metal-dependent hydrolase (beta-lactamase superfamily II)
MRIQLAVITAACAFCADPDARSVLEGAVKAIGNPKSVQYSGSGAVFTLGQNVSPSVPWPRVEVKSFTRVIDYEKLASRNEAVGAQGPAPTQFLSGDKAWGQAASGNVTRAPAAVADRQLQIWVSPHGFLKGALAGEMSARSRKVSGRRVTEVTFARGSQRFVGTISEASLVEKVESWLDNPVLGDMHVVTTYSDYRDFGGIKYPTKIVQTQGGFPVLDLTVTEARSADGRIDVPAAIQQAAPPAVKVASEKLADGIWYLTGGSHHSVLVEFKDHVAVIEGPQNEDRSNAVIAEVKKLTPGKPIRYIVNTHHHFDHSGGLRTYVAEGATLVTHEINAPFYKRTMKAPHTLNPDRLSREKKPKLNLITLDARHPMTDGVRTLEIHHIAKNPHNEGIVMAYFPKEKILVEVDVYSPPPPNAPPPSAPNPAAVNLYENIERLKLDVDRIAPLHGRVVSMADLRKAVGR